jgi:hypothetical protein
MEFGKTVHPKSYFVRKKRNTTEYMLLHMKRFDVVCRLLEISKTRIEYIVIENNRSKTVLLPDMKPFIEETMALMPYIFPLRFIYM